MYGDSGLIPGMDTIPVTNGVQGDYLPNDVADFSGYETQCQRVRHILRWERLY